MKQLETVQKRTITKTPSENQRVIFLVLRNIKTPSFTLTQAQLVIIQLIGFFVFFLETPLETVVQLAIVLGSVIGELKLVENTDMKELAYNYCTLNDQGGDVSKRWSITFWVYSVDAQKKVRKFDYSVNKYKTESQRRSYAKKRIETINSLLEKGYHIDNTKKQTATASVLTVNRALDFALGICSVSHASRLSYSSTISIFSKWCKTRKIEDIPIDSFSKKNAFEYRDELKAKGKVGKTINTDVACLKSMWNILKKRELVKENPWTILDKEKEIITNRNIAYTWGEVSQLASVISEQDAELWQFISIIYHTLARPNEIRQLQVYNIHLNKRKIFIDAKKSKSKKDRWINMHDGLIETIIDLVKNKSSNDFLFPGTEAGKPISKNRMTDRHRQILQTLGLDDGEHTLYSWKHTGVVQAYEAGVDLKSIQQQCGHSSIMETDNYLKSLGLYNNFEIIMKQPALPALKSPAQLVTGAKI